MASLNEAIVQARQGVVLANDEVQSPFEVQATLAAWKPWDLLLVAEAPDGLAGSVDIRRPRPRACRHNGMLTMGVHPAHQGKGVGRALLEAALRWAETEGLERVELFVMADNQRARNLYDSFGFEPTYLRPGFIRWPDGRQVDDQAMSWSPPHLRRSAEIPR